VETGVQSIYKPLKGLDSGFAGMTKKGFFRIFTSSSKLVVSEGKKQEKDEFRESSGRCRRRTIGKENG